MFFKRKNSVSIGNNYIKFLFKISGDSIERKLHDVVLSINGLAGTKIGIFSLNYKKDKKIELLINTKVAVNDFDSIFFGGDDSYNFLISKAPIKSSIVIYEASILFPRSHSGDEELILSVARAFLEEFDVLYGYARYLPADFSPVSETKIKKSFFGNLSVDSTPFDKHWFSPPETIVNGGVKGLYLKNFIRDESFNNPLIKKAMGFESSKNIVISQEITCLEVSSEILVELKKDKSIGEFVFV